MSKNLANQYENEVICEKIEEKREMREEQDAYESDAEYGYDDITEEFIQWYINATDAELSQLDDECYQEYF